MSWCDGDVNDGDITLSQESMELEKWPKMWWWWHWGWLGGTGQPYYQAGVEGELPITKGPDDTLTRLSHHYLLLTGSALQWGDGNNGNDDDEENDDDNNCYNLHVDKVREGGPF